MAATVEEILQEGLAAQEAGRLDDAAECYGAVLHRDPRHFLALHLSGDLRARAGAHEEAIVLMRRALDGNPRSAESHFNLGNSLHALARIEEAIAQYAQALALKPDYARAHNNLGHALLAQGQRHDALAAFESAVQLDPDDAEAQYNLGVALQALGRHEAALARYRSAALLHPDFAEAWNNLGDAAAILGLAATAIDAFERAIALRPDFAAAHYNLGNALQRLDRYADAASCYERALALAPDHAEAHNNLGATLKILGRRDEAMEHYRAALALDPTSAAALNNLGNLLQGLNRIDEAIAAYEAALAIAPDYAEALSHYGTALKARNRHDEAATRHDAAVAIRPDYAEGQLNQGLLRLAMGDFTRGWRQYEWRWRSGGWGARRRNVAQPVWLGQDDPRGQTILLYAEQGFGDTIQFVRYAPLLARRGARVLVEAQPSLLPLLASLPGIAGVYPAGAKLPQFDRHCPMSSLPLAFGTTLDDVPAAIPYLAPPGDLAARWQSIIGGDPGYKIGLAWAGNPDHNNDHNRSLPAALLRPLLDVPGCRFFSVQKDLPPGDAEALAADDRLALLGDQFADFAETAGAIAALDLVITVDTAVAHLAGALGKNVWILLPFSAEWRWLIGRSDSPWYPTARLYRQDAIGAWPALLRRVAADLAMLIEQGTLS